MREEKKVRLSEKSISIYAITYQSKNKTVPGEQIRYGISRELFGWGQGKRGRRGTWD